MRRPADLAWLRSAAAGEATQQQLARLGSMLAIQHALHSQTEVTGVVHAVLEHAREVHPCDAVAVGVEGAPGAHDIEWLSSREEGKSRIATRLTSEEATALCTPGRIFSWESGEAGSPPSLLGPLADAGMRSAVALPLVARGTLCGILALGQREQPGFQSELLPYLTGFADAAAIALSNARSVFESQALARYDSLTGLPNRRIFFDRLQQILSAAERHKHLTAACFIDLDGFKRVNDTLGHAAGDRVIRQVAARLVECLRQSDHICRALWAESVAETDGTDDGAVTQTDEDVSRLGGDEFAVILSKIADPQDAGLVAKRIAAIFERPFELDGREIFLSASVGIAVYPTDGTDADSLLRNADTAMYCAKKRGRNCFQFYTKSMNSEASRRLHIETRLRSALDRDEFEVWYQQQRCSQTGALVGTEALLRWNAPDMGMVSPAEFIPLAEQTGCIVPIGERVLRDACRQMRTWRERGYAAIRMAVNVSAYQLRSPDFVQTVAAILEEAAVSPGQLDLEITETAIMDDDAGAVRALGELHAMGVGLSLDDFGTGYSSLGYLRRFALDRIKIDRSFVAELPDNRDDRALTEAIIAMAHRLRLRVVAEGVETEAQARYLRDRNCDEFQGFLFGRPAPADEFERILEAEKSEDEE